MYLANCELISYFCFSLSVLLLVLKTFYLNLFARNSQHRSLRNNQLQVFGHSSTFRFLQSGSFVILNESDS